VPSGCGIVNPVEEIGRLLAPYRCVYAVDASHAVGQLPVDVARIGCHLLTGDGWRFLRGPQGIGFAYAGERLRQALAPGDAEPQARPQGAAVVALHAALAEHPVAAGAGVELLPRLLDAVTAVPGLEPVAPGRVQSGILTFHHPRLSAALIRRRLAEEGVIAWKTVAGQTPLLDLGEGVGTAVRVSAQHDTTPAGLELFAEALDRVVWEEHTRAVFVPRAPQPVHAPAVAASGLAAPLPFARAAAAGAAFTRPSFSRPGGGRSAGGRRLALLPVS
jgi:selenocysteine lyase/cysteine desulfurase